VQSLKRGSNSQKLLGTLAKFQARPSIGWLALARIAPPKILLSKFCCANLALSRPIGAADLWNKLVKEASQTSWAGGALGEPGQSTMN